MCARVHAGAPLLWLCDSVTMQSSRAGAGDTEGACAAATMAMELIYSRCNHCNEQAFQCSACLANDNATKKARRAAAAQAKIANLMASVDASVDAAYAAPLASPAPQEPSAPAPAPEPSAAVVLEEKVEKKKRVRVSKAKATTPAAPPAASVSASESDSETDGLGSNCDDGDDEGVPASKKSCTRKKSMPRILPAERVCVENWLQKTRKDGAMQNARWIRNGGAKHATMTATSAEVKTQGAYESLALYVNKSLKYGSADPRFWDVDIAKRRWISLFKSFKEALLLDSKGNSMAGCTLLEIQSNSTSVLKKQKLKCGSFDVMFEM